MKARNTPLPASWLKNDPTGPLPFGPPPPWECGAASRRAIPISSGNNAVTASSSRFRFRRKTSLSSEQKNLSQARTGPGAVVREPGSPGLVSVAAGSAVSLPVDIEALPGQAHEQLFQAGRGDRETADADPVADQLGADAFR